MIAEPFVSETEKLAAEIVYARSRKKINKKMLN